MRAAAVWGVAVGMVLIAPAQGAVRELSTDRPDTTESAKTVDKGMFQLESTLFGYSYDSNAGTKTTTISIGESNFKYGLLDKVDLQFVFVPYTKETTETGGVKSVADGFGDLVFRAKYNVWGNDEGSTAFGLLPFVKVPTRTELSNRKVEGGLVTPFSWDVSDRWGIGGQLSFETIYDDADRRMEFGVGHTVVVGYSVTDAFGAYLEYFGFTSEQPYESYLSGGVTYALGEMVQLDLAGLLGLNDASTDIQLFTGLSWKF